MADIVHPGPSGPPRPADCKPAVVAGDGEFEAILLRAVTNLSGATGDQVYRELASCAATLIDADIAFIGVQAPGEEAGIIDTIAAWFDGQAVPNFRYCLEGTPCATVVGRQFRYIRSGIRTLYTDPHIAEWGLEAYAAFPLTSSRGRPLGLIATMSRRPIENPQRVESLLRIFAERAVAELERSEAESAKRASEGLYRAVFEASVDGLALVDEDGVMVDVNQALATMGGFTREELIGRSSLEFLPPESRAHGRRFLEQVLTEGYARTEQKIRHKSGAILRFEPRGVPVAYLGRPHVLIIMRDITEARARQRALERSEDRLRATVEAALDCIVSMDQHGKVLDFNPAAERCFGYRREDTIGRPLAELIDPVIPGEPPGRFMDCLEVASPLLGQRTELVCRRADGSAVPMEAALGVAEGYEGRIFVAYLRDISNQKAVEREREILEHQLRQAQKMEAIGHLTGGIAHDFNNILTGILGYIDLALEHCAGSGDHRLERYLDRARRSGERARDLIQQMLTFSRGGRGEARPLCLSKLVDDCVTLLESTLPASIEIETVTPRNLPAVVLDPVHASQVLMNLSINARDAMDGRGTLRIELAERPNMHGVCSSCRQPFAGHYIETTVADTGSGIPPEIVDRIFEPFFSTKPTGKGSGMGLATTHGLVHEYYGHIVVESAPGEGTRLRLLLPAADGPAVTCAADETHQLRVQPTLLEGRVLVVDDNAAVAEFMEDLLGEWGLTVTVMRDSERAAEVFARAPDAFDLALCDQTMPRLTGIELAGRLLEAKPDLPVILYTGHSDVVSEASTAAAGIRALVRKPIDSARLRALIAGLLAGRERVEPALSSRSG